MPLVRIDLPEATSHLDREAVGAVVYHALVEVAGAPENDRFVITNAHDPASLVMDPTYVGPDGCDTDSRLVARNHGTLTPELDRKSDRCARGPRH